MHNLTSELHLFECYVTHSFIKDGPRGEGGGGLKEVKI